MSEKCGIFPLWEKYEKVYISYFRKKILYNMRSELQKALKNNQAKNE